MDEETETELTVGAVYEFWTLSNGKPRKAPRPVVLTTTEPDHYGRLAAYWAISAASSPILPSQIGAKLADTEDAWFAELRNERRGDGGDRGRPQGHGQDR